MLNQLQRGDEPALLPCRRSGFLRRPYLTKQGDAVVILLAGGDKSSQDKDIRFAKGLARNL